MAEVQRITWMTSTWPSLYGVYLWTLHSKLQFILVETTWRIYDSPRINSWSLWKSFSKWLKSWTSIRQKSVVWPRLITKNLRGDRRLYYVTKRLRLGMPNLCLRRLGAISEKYQWPTNRSLEEQNYMVFGKSLSQRSESNWWRVNGVRVENIPRIHQRFKQMTELQCEPEQFKGRIIFMSMYNDRAWKERGNTEKCFMNSVTVANYARRFLLGRWSFWWLGSEKKWHGTYSDKADGDWDKTAELMMLNFCRKRSPNFSCHQRPGERRIKKQRKGKKSVIHFNGSEETIELILCPIISVNQLRIYGAVADLRKEISKDSEVAGKIAANEDLDSMEIPTELPTADPHTNAELQENMLQCYEHKFERLPEDQKLS